MIDKFIFYIFSVYFYFMILFIIFVIVNHIIFFGFDFKDGTRKK